MQNKLRSFLFLASLALSFNSFSAEETSTSPKESNPPPAAIEEGQLPLAELRNFVQAFEHISKAYVEEIDDKTLLESAIKSLLASLDPHSSYLNKEKFDALQEYSTGTFGGLGIEVGMEDGYVEVISPIDDTPAQRAGILAGDLITKIDDQLVRGMTLQEAIDLMRGEKGSQIELMIARKNHNKPLEFTLTRDTIRTKSVRFETLDEGLGYIRIAQFQEKTGEQFRDAIEQLTEKSPLSGLIIDLRNNPGGLLTASLEVADTLITDGLIVYTEGRIKNAASKFHANREDMIDGVPVVVIINGGSASASEIVAGALQDHRRAIIVGTQSFGKGSVQTVVPLDDTRAIKLTTARYFTPNGRSIQAQGIKPDIEIKPAKVELLDEVQFIKEENLSGHLENGSKETEEKNQKQERRHLDDNVLQSALNLLKGVVLLNKSSEDEPET